jgi:putative transposase
MPRQPRLIVSGYPYHVILRGNNRSDIFYNDKDRRFFIECLKKSKGKTASKIYSYCLMTNHAHFIIEPSRDNGLAEMMQSLGRRYVQYVNSRYKRTGTLWEGRYRSALVDKDGYLAVCSRYIELNPVRAKIVKFPDEYRWSSFRSKTTGNAEDFLDMDPAYLDMGKTDEERRSNYRKWVMESIPEHELDLIRLATQKCGIIGSGTFIRTIEKTLGRSVALKPRGRPRKSL